MMNSIRVLVLIFLFNALPNMVAGQENRNKRTFNSFKAKKVRPKYVVPQMESLPPETVADIALEDSLAREYQQWLKMKPKKMRMEDNLSRQYIQPDLKKLNPEKKMLPEVTYHYDAKNVREENKMHAPPKALVTFDAAQLLNKDARDRARDKEHLERAKRLMKDY